MPLSEAAAYPLWANSLIFLASGIVVWFAGVRLTRHLNAIAQRTGMGHAFVGMLFLGGITSLPEVANVTNASIIGNPSLAINNLLGSAAINVLLLAVADAWVGRQAVTSIVARPSTMMMATLCLLVLIAIAGAVTLGDVEVLGFGIASLLICVFSIGAFWLSAGYDARSPWSVKMDKADNEEPDEDAGPAESLARLWLRTATDGALIFAAGYALSQTGDAIAQQTGLESAFVGFAFIGVATSMPELSTILTALRLRRPEMAFGQVLGTNFINLSLMPLSDALYTKGSVIDELGKFEVVSALLGATLIAIFMVGLLEHRDKTILKMGYDSAAVIVIFALGFTALATI